MGKNSQKRAAAREAEQLAKRRALEEQFGIKIVPSKPEIGGRYALVREPSPLRYPQPEVTRDGTGLVKAVRRG